MENLQERIKITETLINDGNSWNTDVWLLNVMKNQVTIMETLAEMKEELNKTTKKPLCGCGPR